MVMKGGEGEWGERKGEWIKRMVGAGLLAQKVRFLEAAYASVRASPTISRHFSHGEAIPRERTAGHCRNTFHGSYLVKPLLASDQILLCQHLGVSHLPLWLVSSCICDSSTLLKAASPAHSWEQAAHTLVCYYGSLRLWARKNAAYGTGTWHGDPEAVLWGFLSRIWVCGSCEGKW